METIYLYENMEDHLFQVVTETGQVLDEVDILSAEGIDNRYRKCGVRVQWIDRGPSKERKHVRQLMATFNACGAGCSCRPVRVGV